MSSWGPQGTIRNSQKCVNSSMRRLFVQPLPQCCSSTNTGINSSIPLALFKSTVVLDEGCLCTSTSKHRQNSVWPCSINLSLLRLKIKKYTNITCTLLLIWSKNAVKTFSFGQLAHLQVKLSHNSMTLEYPHSQCCFLPIFNVNRTTHDKGKANVQLNKRDQEMCV